MDVTNKPPKAQGAGRSGPRRKTGCLTCRSRKVRCDESKPTCANCTRLRLQCVYRNSIVGGLPRRGRTRLASSSGLGLHTLRSGGSGDDDNDASASTEGVSSPSAIAVSSSAEKDANFLETVLRPRDQDLDGFDMLGFMGSMTEEFEQRGLNLRDTASSLNDGCDGGDHGVLEKGALPNIDEAICTVDEGPGPGALDVYERQLLAQFGEMDAPPTIFGSITLEWKYVRSVILSQARESAPLLNAVYCYSEVFMGHKRRLASVYHQRASSEIQACELENVSDILLKQVFAAVFLLMLAELLSGGLGRPDSFLHSAYLLLQRYHRRTESWAGFGRLIVSWVSLLDVKSLIAGREGDPLIELGTLDVVAEPDRKADDELLSNPSYLMHETLIGPAFAFFYKAQQVIRRIVCIDLHHRTRGTVSDEFDVLQIAHQISADLETLWNTRPRVLDVSHNPEILYDTLQPSVAVEVCRMFRQYVANFLAIFIYLHRVAFAIYPRTDRVHRAVDQIIQLATVESTESHLPISFVWPLFVAALEGSFAQRQWIIQGLQRMARPSDCCPVTQRHPSAKKALLLLEEMTRRQDAWRSWADSRCVRRELFTDPFVII